MDPDATLRMIREMCKDAEVNPDSDVQGDLAEAIENLDKWICDGGALPSDWEEA